MMNFENLKSKYLTKSDVGFESKYYNLLANIYNTQAKRDEKLDPHFLKHARAKLVLNDKKEVVGGFFYTTKKDDLMKLVNDIKLKEIGYGGVYISGLCIDPYFKSDMSAVNFFQANISDLKKQYGKIWGIISNNQIMKAYERRGFRLIKLPYFDDYYLVEF